MMAEVEEEPVAGENLRVSVALTLTNVTPTCHWRRSQEVYLELLGHEHDLELAPVEIVADDDLVPVPLDCLTRFGQEEVLVGFQLDKFMRD